MAVLEGRIFTGNETWVYHYNPESKQQPITRKHPTSPPLKKLKVIHPSGNVLCMVFSYAAGIFMVYCLLRHQTIAGSYYTEVLKKRLKSCHQGQAPWKAPSLWQQSCSHALLYHGSIKDCAFVELPHLPHSPALAPSDFSLFPYLNICSEEHVLLTMMRWFQKRGHWRTHLQTRNLTIAFILLGNTEKVTGVSKDKRNERERDFEKCFAIQQNRQFLQTIDIWAHVLVCVG